MGICYRFKSIASLFLEWGILLFAHHAFSQTSAQWITNAQQDKPLLQRLDNLDNQQLDSFMLGRSFFSIPWVAAPSATTARDGLGPLFNANTCISCHIEHGAGQALSAEEQPLRALVVKLSQPIFQTQALAKGMINMPDPIYGGQIAINAVGHVPIEAIPRLEQQSHTVTYPDGETVTLTKYFPKLTQLGYGELSPDTVISLRQAQTLAGLALIAQVSDAEILRYVDEQDSDGDGISGRANWVQDKSDGQQRLGRFGWKASQPNILQQTADAAANDMGLTNPFFPEERCTPAQQACLEAPRGRLSPLGKLDLPASRLQAIADYVTAFKAPQAMQLNETALMGQQLFQTIGCETCHRREMTTTHHIRFSPYSDYLLHDMGEDLSDGRPEFLASAQEWRTAPLWGIGAKVRAKQRFLHDARASTLQEAILWHGGEAEHAKNRFIQLTQEQRQSILIFLEAL